MVLGTMEACGFGMLPSPVGGVKRLDTSTLVPGRAIVLSRTHGRRRIDWSRRPCSPSPLEVHLYLWRMDSLSPCRLEEAMRKLRLLALGLALAAVAALAPAPKAEAVTCSWECGPCGLVCPCDSCRGPVPFCVCLTE